MMLSAVFHTKVPQLYFAHETCTQLAHSEGEVYFQFSQGLTLEDTFTRIYATSAWGKGSGAGSLPAHCLKWSLDLNSMCSDAAPRSPFNIFDQLDDVSG